MYKDAGLADPYEVRQKALSHDACSEHRQKVSKKLVNFFVRNGMLESVPAL